MRLFWKVLVYSFPGGWYTVFRGVGIQFSGGVQMFYSRFLQNYLDPFFASADCVLIPIFDVFLALKCI